MAIAVLYATSATMPPITLLSAGTRSSYSNPVIAAGDVQISKDYGTFTNIATLPTVSGVIEIKVDLSATEATCKVGMIRFKDQTSPADWDEKTISFYTYGNALAFDTRGVMAGTDGKALISTDAQDLSATLTVNVGAISFDSVAADNLEAQFDGTGLLSASFPARQDQMTNLVSTGAATNVAAASFSATTATIASGAVSATAARDGIYHQLQDVAGTLDVYYQFSVGTIGVPTAVFIYGGVTSNNDTILIQGYNWDTSAWLQVGSITGVNSLTPAGNSFPLYTSMVGTGANVGVVRIRLTNTGLTTSNTYIDQIYVSYATVNTSVGYLDGAIWVDTVNGTAGTTLRVNGTADRPVLTWAEALTLAAALGVKRFRIISGSSITLTGNSDNYVMIGDGAWTLALGGQSCSGSVFVNAGVTGVCTGSNPPQFYDCDMGTVTIPASHVHGCGLISTITVGTSGDFFFDQCFSEVAGDISTNSPTIDFDAVGATNVSLRHYAGGIRLDNMGADDKITIAGTGLVNVLNTCTSATVVIRGSFELVDGGTSTTVVDSARWAEDQDITNVTGSLTDKANFTLSASEYTAIATATASDVLVTPANKLATDASGRIDMGLVYGLSATAEKMSKAGNTMVMGTVTDSVASPTTTQIDASDITDAASDYYKTRTLIFTSGALVNEARAILGYSLVSGVGRFVVDAFTSAPANGDTFIIV